MSRSPTTVSKKFPPDSKGGLKKSESSSVSQRKSKQSSPASLKKSASKLPSAESPMGIEGKEAPSPTVKKSLSTAPKNSLSSPVVSPVAKSGGDKFKRYAERRQQRKVDN
eukprot:GILI01049301.1.p1 GENE.GILI01049301.1~~GILI01049301.1.p1  ORF type:complete len:128 (+),score=18.78 GILI01049301.1:56-385(+)